MEVNPKDFDDFRVGDEDPDAHIGDFNVYGGTPSDRVALQNGEPDSIANLEEELRAILTRHDEETRRTDP